MIARLAILAAAGALLTACNTTGSAPATIAGGCGSFRPLPHEIRATTPDGTPSPQGQVWVDGTSEVLVKQCGFPRPKKLAR